jgi:hypothetical protein
LDDASLAKVISNSGSITGRYPGGTPSDYWNYTTGYAMNGYNKQPGKPYDWPPVRQATPKQWAAYCAASHTVHTVVCLNQLTNTLAESLDGLHALAAAGTPVTHIELGNEQYDDTRADVMAVYPTGNEYAAKMATWSAAIKKEFPHAKIALVTMSWRSSLNPHLASWNSAVFNATPAPSRLAAIKAATIHPYFRLKSVTPQHPDPVITSASQLNTPREASRTSSTDCGAPKMGASGDWIATEKGCADACCCAAKCAVKPQTCRAWQWMIDPSDANCYLKANATLAKNSGSISGVAGPLPPPPPPSAGALATALATPFQALVENARMLVKDVPKGMEVWVTEVAAYGAPELNFTWLRALVDVLFETLLMLRMHTSEGLGAEQVTVLTPYCAACADPMAPSFETLGAASSGSRAVLPIGKENSSVWAPNVRGIAHQLLFAPIAEARAVAKDDAKLQELVFDVNPALADDAGAKWNASALVGFSLRSGTVAETGAGANAPPVLPLALVLFNLCGDPIDLTIAGLFGSTTSSTSNTAAAAVLLDVTSRYPSSTADLVNQSLTTEDLLAKTSSSVKATTPIELPPYSMTAVRRQDAQALRAKL